MDRLQRIARGRVANMTPFGREFRAFCGSPAMLAHTPDHGFLDGGCLSLALAVLEWLGPEAELRFAARDGRLQHAAAEVVVDGRPLYLDGDGLATDDDLAEKLARLEFCPGTVPVGATVGQAAAHGIVDDGRSEALAAALAERFGNVPPSAKWIFGLDAAPEPPSGPTP